VIAPLSLQVYIQTVMVALSPEETGLEVSDLRSDAIFAARKLHEYDTGKQMAGLQRLTRAFVEQPTIILQELVNVAVDLCGADSAGISIETGSGNDADFYHWIATAGTYSPFLDAHLPRYPSACGLTLERGHPQHFIVTQKFFDILGVEAPLVTDGILLPWQTEDIRGTIFVMAHDRTEAFDSNDARIMTMLADFASMGYRQMTQQAQILAQARSAAAAQVAHDLAHEINNPLQSMSNVAFLVASGRPEPETKELGTMLSKDIARLSGLVKKILELPFEKIQSRR
jgi:hypothetical protein